MASRREKRLSFRYEDAQATGPGGSARVCEGLAGPIEGVVYVYATFEMGPANPVRFLENGAPEWGLTGDRPAQAGLPRPARRNSGVPDGFVVREHRPAPDSHPRFLETVVLGQQVGDEFAPVVRFGLGNDSGSPEKAHVTPWVSDGRIDYFGPYARPNTPCDTKLKLDLPRQRMTAWVRCRGDDDWFLLAEDVPLTSPAGPVTEVQAAYPGAGTPLTFAVSLPPITHVQVEQYPGGPAIKGLTVRSEPWAPGERVRPRPLAKQDRVVARGKGFKFQAVRSTWRRPGKHVTIFRRPGVHCAFPDVAVAGPDHLVCVWRNGSHTGGTGGLSLAHSYDLGQTWSEPVVVCPLSANCPRIQRLKDGSLLLLTDVATAPGSHWLDDPWDVVFYDSVNGGHTWANERWLRPREVGGECTIVPSRVTELSDGSWLVSASSFVTLAEGDIAEKLQVYRSTNRGHSWEFWSGPMAYPPFSVSEPAMVELSPGRIAMFGRESRSDGMPGMKGFSEDGGKTWRFQELAHPFVGRSCFSLLNDGRGMVTYRTEVGRPALHAWVGDIHDPTPSRPAGAHVNDRHSVGLKDGALHIDNDGRRGQFTRYSLRPPDSTQSTVDLTAEVQVLANAGRAATLSAPFAGKLRLFPDHAHMAHDPSLRIDVTPGRFHTYRVVSRVGRLIVLVDGEPALDTDRGDDTVMTFPWLPFMRVSPYAPSFGNEAISSRALGEEHPEAQPLLFARDITPEVTGYSIWRSVEEVIDDPRLGRRVISWSATRDGFPDQYQLDHMVEVGATVNGHDQGYSGWVQLDDGRIFVVEYTDDTAAGEYPTMDMFGVPWIRGTFLSLSDLPSRARPWRRQQRV